MLRFETRCRHYRRRFCLRSFLCLIFVKVKKNVYLIWRHRFSILFKISDVCRCRRCHRHHRRCHRRRHRRQISDFPTATHFLSLFQTSI